MTQTPKIGALAVVIHEGRVLLAQRGKDPDRGLWGFPGGHVEWGETTQAAAERELLEETGVTASAGAWLANLDLIARDDAGAVTSHYLLVGVLCDYVSGVPQANDDVTDAAWFPVRVVMEDGLPLSKRVTELLRLALCEQSDG